MRGKGGKDRQSVKSLRPSTIVIALSVVLLAALVVIVGSVLNYGGDDALTGTPGPESPQLGGLHPRPLLGAGFAPAIRPAGPRPAAIPATCVPWPIVSGEAAARPALMSFASNRAPFV